MDNEKVKVMKNYDDLKLDIIVDEFNNVEKELHDFIEFVTNKLHDIDLCIQRFKK